MSSAVDLRRARLAVVGLTLLYATVHLAWYGTTPLGGFPVLDGREMLELARAIAAGELPHGVGGTLQVGVIVAHLHHIGGAKGLGAL